MLFLLHRRISALRVQSEGGGYVGMAQQTLHRLRILLLIYEESGEAVPQIVKPETLSRLEHDASLYSLSLIHI